MQIIYVPSTNSIQIISAIDQSIVVASSTTSLVGSAITNSIDFTQVDTTNVGDGYVFAYKESTQSYVFEDPDDMLSKSVEDNSLPTKFINILDEDLDNRIDADGGLF